MAHIQNVNVIHDVNIYLKCLNSMKAVISKRKTSVDSWCVSSKLPEHGYHSETPF